MSQLRYLIQWFPAAAIPFFLFDRSLSAPGLSHSSQGSFSSRADPIRSDPIRFDPLPIFRSIRWARFVLTLLMTNLLNPGASVGASA